MKKILLMLVLVNTIFACDTAELPEDQILKTTNSELINKQSETDVVLQGLDLVSRKATLDGISD